MVRGSGTALPIRSGAVDVCYSSNVLEHVATPEAMLDEMVRVTRPGGTVFVSFTPWLSPWGGHETAPWHYLGGDRARRRYVRRTGREPKNRFRRDAVPGQRGAGDALGAGRGPAGRSTIVDVLPRYHPWWARWVARVPAAARDADVELHVFGHCRTVRKILGVASGCDSVVTFSPAGSSSAGAFHPYIVEAL